MMKTLCACGRRMSRYSPKCNTCMEAMRLAGQQRIARVNEAIAKGGKFVIDTFLGKYEVAGFGDNYDAVCFPVGKEHSIYNQHTFALHGGHVVEAEKALGL